MAELVIRSEVYEAGELELVPRASLVEALRSLRDKPEQGKALRRGLTGLRSIRVGGSENRLVYEYSADTDRVVVIAIGRRRDDEVYDMAERRAG
jgi:mRNA-degrading endonuclease RelE of RelBE toxin-antitoxin system